MLRVKKGMQMWFGHKDGIEKGTQRDKYTKKLWVGGRGHP